MKEDKKVLFDGTAELEDAKRKEKEIEEEMSKLRDKYPEMSETELFRQALKNTTIKWQNERKEKGEKLSEAYYEGLKKARDPEFVKRILDKIKD